MEAERRRIDIEGMVQGVGFRPFVFRLANHYQLSGWVCNTRDGVCLEVQGSREILDRFVAALPEQAPAHAVIENMHCQAVTPEPQTGFVIRSGDVRGARSSLCQPDLAPCNDCLNELFDPDNRRYRYPFIHCTQCGPRFSLITRLPFARAATGMRDFPLCLRCLAEFNNPEDRRFHSETTACPDCGPRLAAVAADGRALAICDAALEQAVAALANGKIVALKSIGGFQLLVDAGNADAVARLRCRKQRPTKPFALLYPHIAAIEGDCDISPLERELLLSAERPIVILAARQSPATPLAGSIAPGNPDLGIMLPCSPLHSLLMSHHPRPLVATSGNLSGEPICIDNDDALQKLGNIADLFLLHDRPILRALDDSVIREIDGRGTLLRRSRGYVPRPLPGPPVQQPMLAVGGQMKSSVALAAGRHIHLSQHLGELDNAPACENFERTIADLLDFHRLAPHLLIRDLHPDYFSSQWAQARPEPGIAAPHHLAHFCSVLAEHQHLGPALGVCWDGIGYGEQGSLRGGEFYHWDGLGKFRRIASLRPFPLPGGGQAIREPRRCALGLLYAMRGCDGVAEGVCEGFGFSPPDSHNLRQMLNRGVNTPHCSSIGRLFDGVSALLGLCQHNQHEGQAAMALEAATRQSNSNSHYPASLNTALPLWQLDWEPLLTAMLNDLEGGVAIGDIAATFHASLAHWILAVVQRFCAVETDKLPVFLSGGVFQNRRLTEATGELLRQHTIPVFRHQQVPPNDGGLALGQIYYSLCLEKQQSRA